MELKNGYKLVYAKKDASGKIDLFASKTGIPAAGDKELNIDSYLENKDIKLVYVDAQGAIKVSTTGIPAATDSTVSELNEIYVEANEEAGEGDEPVDQGGAQAAGE